MPARRTLVPAGAFAATAFLVGAGSASAQVLQVPRSAAEVTTPRTSDSPLTTSLLLNGSAFGGYDDNVSEGGDFGGQPGAPPLQSSSGTIGQFGIGLDYRRSKGRGGIDFGAQANAITYGGDADLGPTKTAALTFGAHTGLGRSSMLNITEALSYDSTYGLDTFGAIDDPVGAPGELPTSSSVNGIIAQESWASQTGVSIDRQWSRRDSTNVGYDYARRTFTGSNGETSNSHAANASYTRQLTRVASASAVYAYSSSEYAGSFTAGPSRPVDSHNIEGNVAWTKRVSPRRSLHVGFGGGASRIETVSTDVLLPYTYWAPTANVDARLDLSQTWSLAGNFRRTTTGFEGISRETFLSDIFGVTVGGTVGPRVRLVFAGGGATGNVDASAAGEGHYTTVTGAVQVSVSLTRALSATAQYTYYTYDFSAETELPTGLPPEFNRNAVRVGLTMALPLSGRQSSRSRP